MTLEVVARHMTGYLRFHIPYRCRQSEPMGRYAIARHHRCLTLRARGPSCTIVQSEDQSKFDRKTEETTHLSIFQIVKLMAMAV
eukprot:SAG11_NODE_12674_length_691_cov_1.185811_1_plen_84_part_00